MPSGKQRRIDVADVDTALQFGVNYPHGLLEWAGVAGLERVAAIRCGDQHETDDTGQRHSCTVSS